MKTRVDLRLLEEVRRFDLRFTCDDCAHFARSSDVSAGGDGGGAERCAHGWPRGERSRPLSPGEQIEFCKEFEAG
ncbi:MAG: hypothetical protein HYV09_30285 [Deltaproteobacteria bacterium]|nr:hypothetical protein [Deltaproteobacteria bacterium]